MLIALYCCPYSSQKYINKIEVTLHNQITNFQPIQFIMTSEIAASTQDLTKLARKSIQFGSHSPRSDKYPSASRSMKAFEESLRKQDSNNGKSEDINSPLKKRLSFGKCEIVHHKSNEKIYLVDTNKKIKQVESPFKESPYVEKFQEKIQSSEIYMLVSCFDSISEKIEDQGQSSIQLEKQDNFNEEIKFETLNLGIKQLNCDYEVEKIQEAELLKENQIGGQKDQKNSLMELQVNEDLIEDVSDSFQNQRIESMSVESLSEDALKENSASSSVKSKTSQTGRLRKKEIKIKKRKDKRRNAKKIKIKLTNITNFVDELHRKQAHTDRKDLISQLTQHLSQSKFGRLRNELKRLI